MIIDFGENADEKFTRLKQVLFRMRGSLEDFSGDYTMLCARVEHVEEIFTGQSALDDVEEYLIEKYYIRHENAKFAIKMINKAKNRIV